MKDIQNSKYDEIKDLLYKFSALGNRTSKTGAILIGHAPNIAEEAWINTIYPVLNAGNIKKLESATGIAFPVSFVAFLTGFSNGLNILNTTLCLYGYINNYNRDIELSRQPFSIIEPNVYENPKDATKEMLFIGGYDWDGSQLYMMPDGKVHYCHRDCATSLMVWDNLQTMLIEEINRLYNLFDGNGMPIDENKSTLPI